MYTVAVILNAAAWIGLGFVVTEIVFRRRRQARIAAWQSLRPCLSYRRALACHRMN
jgi:hypothetical protein